MMKHAVRNDFDTALTESEVTVTFRATNSIYSFYRLADGDVARLGPSRWNVSDTLEQVATLRVTLPMKFKRWRNISP
jgi:hypothetical protein